MGSVPIVIDPPCFDLAACILERYELRDVQTLIAQSSIERLYVPVLCGFSGMDKIKFHTTPVGPFLERLGGELGAVINGDRGRGSCPLDRSIQGRSNILAAEGEARLKYRTLTTKLIDHGEHPKGLAVEHLIMDEIHAPTLVRTLRLRHRTPM